MEKHSIVIRFILVIIITISMMNDCDARSSSKKRQHDEDEDDERNSKPYFRKATIREALKGIHGEVGREFRLNCGVRGYPKPKITFFKEGVKMTSNGRNTRYNSRPRVDIRKTMVRVQSANLSDNGNYSCEARNQFGVAYLNFTVEIPKPIIVNIDPRFPHWTKPSKMLKTLHAEPAGNTVLFKCIAGGDDITTRWVKTDKDGNESEIQRDNRHPSRLGGYKFRHNNQVITLESVVLNDVGKYRCEISNKYGSINHTYELDVTERSSHRPILAFKTPGNRTLRVGDNYTLNCRVYSDAHPYIYWMKYYKVNGSSINPQTNKTYHQVIKKAGINSTEKDLQTFTLRNVTMADAGKYSCVAGNSIGISHVDAWLTVLELEEEEEMEADGPSFLWLFICVPILCGMLVVNMLLWYFRSRNTTQVNNDAQVFCFLCFGCINGGKLVVIDGVPSTIYSQRLCCKAARFLLNIKSHDQAAMKNPHALIMDTRVTDDSQVEWEAGMDRPPRYDERIGVFGGYIHDSLVFGEHMSVESLESADDEHTSVVRYIPTTRDSYVQTPSTQQQVDNNDDEKIELFVPDSTCVMIHAINIDETTATCVPTKSDQNEDEKKNDDKVAAVKVPANTDDDDDTVTSPSTINKNIVSGATSPDATESDETCDDVIIEGDDMGTQEIKSLINGGIQETALTSG